MRSTFLKLAVIALISTLATSIQLRSKTIAELSNQAEASGEKFEIPSAWKNKIKNVANQAFDKT